MKTIASIVLTLLIVSSYTSGATQLNNVHTIRTVEKPKKVVRNFLNWYKENRERLNKYRLVSGDPENKTKAYRVDFAETEKYLNELKKSGFVSNQYISTFRKYFRTADANLEQYPQYEGPPEGFGFDLVLKADDYKEVLDHFAKMKVITKPVNADSVKVYVRFPTVVMMFRLSRSGKSWLIDSLDYV
jgi:hypothetical protein